MVLCEKTVWKVVVGLVVAMFAVGLMISYVLFHERPTSSIETTSVNESLSLLATTTLYANDKSFLAYKATADEDRTRGLSGTEYLASSSAMLFTFPKDDKWGIWMKDMNYAIDVVWLDREGFVVDFKESMSTTTCRSELNCKIFFPGILDENIDNILEAYQKSLPSRYVVEFPEGTIADLKLEKGAQIRFD
jgi:uncharacterized membrane protein (UPF0127 family)